MDSISPLDFEDYKDFIRSKIASNKMERAYQSKLAEASGCQKSFLSQVLNSHVHFMPDHAAALAEFLGLSEEESSYFVDLVLMARAGSGSLRAMLQKRMKAMRDRKANLTERFQGTGLESQHQETYYSSWHWGAIHVLIGIETYKSFSDIAERLGLPVHIVQQTIKWLEAAGIIEKSKGWWKITENRLYLPSTSPMIQMHHFNWRQRALTNIQAQDSTALHYSAAFALSKKDFLKLKQSVVDFIDQANRLIGPSPEEEAVAFTCDVFRI